MKRTCPCILLAATLLAAIPATAAEYLIAPLIGDRLNISYALMTTGTNLRASNDTVKLPQLPWDDAIQTSIVDGVTDGDEKATFKQLAFREGLPGIEILDQADEKEIVAAIVKVMAPLIDAKKKQWIVALWPRKAEHTFKLVGMHIGRGRASGIGFYVDRSTPLISGNTQEADTGFLGMFAYFEIAIVDPASQKIVARKVSKTTQIYAMADGGKTKGHPWELLTSEQKIASVKRTVMDAVDEAMPELMKGVAAAKP